MDQPSPTAHPKAPQRAKSNGADDSAKNARKKKSPFLKWLGGFIALLILLISGAYIILSLEPVRAEFLRAPILNQLHEKMGHADIHMGDIYLSTHALGLVVSVETVNITAQDQQFMARFDQLKLGFSPFLSTGFEMTIAQADIRLPAQIQLSTAMRNLIVNASQKIEGERLLTQADIVAYFFDQAGYGAESGFKALDNAGIKKATINNLSVLLGSDDVQEPPIKGGRFMYRHDANMPDNQGQSFAAFTLSLPAQTHQIDMMVFDQSMLEQPQYKFYFKRGVTSTDMAPLKNDFDRFISLNGPLSVELDLLLGAQNRVAHSVKGIIKTTTGYLSLGLEDYALAQNQLKLDWQRGEVGLTIVPSNIQIGQARANVSGLLDLDTSLINPGLGISLEARNVRVDPTDMAPSDRAFQQLLVRGRYGFAQKRLTVDNINLFDRTQLLSGRGEIEFSPQGAAMSGDLEAQGATLDQTLRLWPSFINTQARAWVLEHVSTGKLEKSYLQFRFPAGSIKPPSQRARIAQDGLTIDIAAQDVTLSLGGALGPIQSNDSLTMSIRDHRLVATVAEATIQDAQGAAMFENVSYEIPDTFLLEQRHILNSRVKGAVHHILRLADKDPINVMQALKLGLVPEDLKGQAELDLQAQFVTIISDGIAVKAEDITYSVTGAVTDFYALKQIQGSTIENGTFTFSANPGGFELNGTASLNGTISDLALTSDKDGTRDVDVRSVLTDKQRAEMGFELLNDYITGPISYRAKPHDDGALEVDVLFKDAVLNISDLAVRKPKGKEAFATFVIKTQGERTILEDFKFQFGNVLVEGQLSFDEKSRLIEADFPTFKLNRDDATELKVRRVADGFEIRLKGEQMNLQSILTRFFGIEEESRLEAQTDIEGVNLTFIADIGRAIGFFKTTAFNVRLDIKVRGPNLLSISGRASLGEDKTLSVSTNEKGSGKVITYAANDVGTMMRFIGLYPRLLGGVGSLVVDYNEGAQTQVGQVLLKDFSLVNERAMVRIVGNHTQSKDFVSAQEQIAFSTGRARFTRSEQALVVEALVLEGPQMGLTLRGSIDSLTKQVDMVGTYIPLLGLNTIFKDVPVIGQLQGDGLIGVTFAIRGFLADPQFAVNPASALAPGVFRRLFEFQQRN